MIEILYEDEGVMVVDKPSGMVVNRAESVKQTTVQDWAVDRLRITDNGFQRGERDKVFVQRAGIAHRLDRETSGCLIIAKNPEALTDLLGQFKRRRVKKTYTALVHGRVEPETGWWNWPLSRSEGKRREAFKVAIDGKKALTEYEAEEYLGKFTLLKCHPVTGRTHQIRVQAAFAKHPLVSDAVYGERRQCQQDRTWCLRHFLHASVITFYLPGTDKAKTVQAPLPSDLQAALAAAKRGSVL